jgi:thiosulfate dehydrogenase (quinone) large subunit
MMGWTFLYAGVWQISENYDTAGFLNHVVTFHDAFAVFAQPALLPFTDFLVKWGHLLIGLSLISGLLGCVATPLGTAKLATHRYINVRSSKASSFKRLLCLGRQVILVALV